MALASITPSLARYQPTPKTLTETHPSPDSQPVSRHPSVRFSGVGDAVSSLISLIDSNRVVELVSSDGLGMLVPRTAVAAGFRGKDDARETLIREAAGLFCVALLSGLSNQFMVRVLGNRPGFYNPHGTPTKAWIGARNLRVYSELYKQALNSSDVHSAEEARQAFLARIFDGLESGDKKLSIHGRLKALKTVARKEGGEISSRNALAQMAKETHGTGATDALQKDYWNHFQANDLDELGKKFVQGGWGRLSAEGKKELLQAFRPVAPGAEETGLASIDKMAWSRVNELHPQAGDAIRQQAFLKQRMTVSLKNLQDSTPHFINRVDQLALNHGLTSVIDLKASDASDAETLTGGQSRQTVLKEVKAFLDHYVDRAGFETGESMKAQAADAFADEGKWAAQRKMLQHRLFAPSAKGLRRLLPHAQDGLVTATLKAKTGYTVVPILVAILANGATTFMNNYITQKKYRGRVFFPGEETYINRQQATVGKTSPAPAGRWA